MSGTAFYLVVDCRYLPIALGLGQRLAKLWQHDVHIFLEDRAAADTSEIARPNLHVHVNRLRGLRPGGLPETANWPAVVYDRIFAPRFLKNYDRTIYLDADVYPIKAEEGAFHFPMNSALAAVRDSASIGFSPHGSGLDPNAWRASLGLRTDRYFNSGVLIISPADWNRIDFAGDLARFVDAHGAAVRMPDQDFLNWRFQDCWTELSPRFNFQKGLFNYGYESWFPPLLVHFSSFEKPWLKPAGAGSVPGQFFKPFRSMVRAAGNNPDKLLRPKFEALPRRLRKAVRAKMSAWGAISGKERRLREEARRRADHLHRAFVEDLTLGRYVDWRQAPQARPEAKLHFDGQYLRRPLDVELELADG